MTQDFTEFELHVGVGAELRFKWFAIEADARVVGLWRDNSDTPASYYGNRRAPRSRRRATACRATCTVSLWF